ncbi:MAG: type I DNA topoisomerase [Candidatus Marinimicrobia bacterium]|nr:type I DNA topoisomerase [Candidatus Neomarinimicrobiota bacterium]
MNKPLIIVESPAKARTIEKYLSNEYEVFACVGHIKDLPRKELAVDVDNEFAATFVAMEGKEDIIKTIKKKSTKAPEVILATDPDREGEAIAAHIAEEIVNESVSRVQFTEITKEGIIEGMENRHEIDTFLVNAQYTRRVIDRLVGYKLSRLLWSTLQKTMSFVKGSLSAGRVQSAALKMIVDRERLRAIFKSATFYDLKAELENDALEGFNADMITLDGKRLAASKDFDSNTGELKKDNVLLLSSSQATALSEELQNGPWIVRSVEEKPQTSNPYAPFTTSTLQQEASRKIRFSARKTMRMAQRLYEAGFITYMRTDSIQLSQEALTGARKVIKDRYGDEFLPDKPIMYKSKVKNAQEAHEAIRPAGVTFNDVKTVSAKAGSDEGKLYDLIWKRTVASQMKPAKLKRTTVDIENQNTVFRARGRVILFPGYMRAYVEGSDNPDGKLADRERFLPEMKEGQRLGCKNLTPEEHNTKPPARFTEASVIKEMEKQGIGRPSTWASIIGRIQEKEYIHNKKGSLVPSFLAVAVTQLLENHFSSLVDSQFTSKMEDELDSISRGDSDPLPFMNSFYFGNDEKPGLEKMLEDEIDIRKACTVLIANGSVEEIVIRVGNYGPYLEQGEERRNIPTEFSLGDISVQKAMEILAKDASQTQLLGVDNESGQSIYLKEGPYGPYVQLGDSKTRKSLPRGTEKEDVDLELASKLLSMPRLLGTHPETGDEIRADFGRYGPYLKVGDKNVKLPHPHDPLIVTLEAAVDVIKNRNKPSSELKTLGKHPDSGEAITLKDGRYGPYVSDGKFNASLPKDISPDDVDLDTAVSLINDRRAKGPAKKRKRRKKK